MKTPKTVKGYLKMLIQICGDSSLDLKNSTEEDQKFLGYIRANIQNELSEDEFGCMKKHNLKWPKA